MSFSIEGKGMKEFLGRGRCWAKGLFFLLSNKGENLQPVSRMLGMIQPRKSVGWERKQTRDQCTSGNRSKETQNTNSKEISTPMFPAALFTITKIWKKPKCPSVGEWMKQ